MADVEEKTILEKGRSVSGESLAGAATSGPPLVSIIVVVFQSLPALRTLLENLASCDLSEAEVIVVDGGSSDGTVELLGACDLVDAWISEPDGGIYDAMNKGIAMARGAYIFHLNAGDALRHLPGATLRACLREGVDVASFAVTLDGARLFRPRGGLRSRIENTWHHQGTFYRREAHQGYDSAYRVYGDFDHNRRLARAGCTVRLFPEQLVADHASGGASSLTARTPALREIWSVVRRHSGILYVPLAYVKLHLYFLVRWARSFASQR